MLSDSAGAFLLLVRTTKAMARAQRRNARGAPRPIPTFALVLRLEGVSVCTGAAVGVAYPPEVVDGTIALLGLVVAVALPVGPIVELCYRIGC
jgi:hypothetical protein